MKGMTALFHSFLYPFVHLVILLSHKILLKSHSHLCVKIDPFLTNSSGSAEFASESSRSLTEEQQQRIERNKQLALERRQAKLLSNSQSLGNGKFYAGFYVLSLIYQGHVRNFNLFTLPQNKIPLGIDKCDIVY